MPKNNSELLQKILMFHPYLQKKNVKEKLNDHIGKFPNFEEVYAQIKEEKKLTNTAEIVARTLVYGFEKEIIIERHIDHLIFTLLEDSLFNSYLFHLDTSKYDFNDTNFISKLTESWNIPSDDKILSNIDLGATSFKGFQICGFRHYTSKSKLPILRILLLDSKPVDTQRKNEDVKPIVFPTIVEIDFVNKLLHLRVRDVDNIINEEQEFSTMTGRIATTLEFVDSLKPSLNYSNITNFRSSLYLLEEQLLQEKREQAYQKLREFDNEINEFTKKVCNKFNPPTNQEIPPKEYIKTGVLSVIATTLNLSELGDVVGIRFRNNNSDDDNKYAEITIKDTGYNCISTSNLYWLNFSVLEHTKAVEAMKMIANLDSGNTIVNLTFAQNTANIKLLYRNTFRESTGAMPNQEKYDDFIEFLVPLIRKINE